jgi:hypothetical protein
MRVNQRNLRLVVRKSRRWLEILKCACAGWGLAVVGIVMGLVASDMLYGNQDLGFVVVGLIVSPVILTLGVPYVISIANAIEIICCVSGLVGTPIAVIAWTMHPTWIRGTMIVVFGALWSLHTVKCMLAALSF